MTLRIVFTGPESSGKTTLAQHLAAHYGAPWVPEYARTYLNRLSRPYEAKDLLEIAQGQLYREDRISAGSPRLLLCDTDLLTIKIWAAYKYQAVDPWIVEQVAQRPYDHYFLCKPDLPWEDDPLRENPDDREELYQRYREELLHYQKPFTEIEGTLEQRLITTKRLIDQWLSLS